jgi:hypothetical protein
MFLSDFFIEVDTFGDEENEELYSLQEACDILMKYNKKKFPYEIFMEIMVNIDLNDDNALLKHDLLVLVGEKLGSYFESLKLCYNLEIIDEQLISTFNRKNQFSSFYTLLHDELVDDNYFGKLDQCNICPSFMNIEDDKEKIKDILDKC